ncbi:MAG: GGDEF domain-containing protein [Rubrivivax sp.]|nr:GGDEF domain-containing protein [Rubrivivax sp.]
MATPAAPGEGPGRARAEQLAALRLSLSEGRWSEALNQGSALHAQWLAVGDATLAVEAALVVAKALFNADRLLLAEVWCRKALALDLPQEAAPLTAAVWVVRAAVQARLENTQGALESIRRALAVMPAAAAASSRRTVYFGVAITYRALGLWHASLPIWRAAQEADLAVDAAGPGLIMTRVNLVDALMRAHDDGHLADAAGAQALLEEALAVAGNFRAQLPQAQTPWQRFFMRHALGSVLMRGGPAQEACATLQDGLDGSQGMPSVAVGAMHLDMARAANRLGLDEVVQRHARLAVERLEADVVAPSGLLPLPSLHDLRQAYALQGDLARAMQTQDLVHARILRNVQALMEAPSEGLPQRLSLQTALLQNADLREAKEGLEREMREASRAAAFDELTALPNRRGLKGAYDALCARHSEVVLVMLDLDDFKLINDNHSHAMGDEVLRQVAAIFTDSLRVPDTVGRFGGEEFVVLLSGLTVATAWPVVDRLRQRIQDHPWAALGTGLRLTLSAGYVAVTAGEPFEEATRRADTLLYEAKRAGRNRVHAEPDPTAS